MPSIAVVALLALAAAAAAFVLPAFDAALPGGAIGWQVAAVVTAIIAAWLVRRRPVAGPRAARWLAAGALLVALVWVGAVALLWLLWPR